MGSGTFTPTQRWLRSVIGPYQFQDFVFSDVDRTLTNFTALSPKTEQYTYDDGRQHLLLCLSGTIPINFKSATYNIPIALWLPHDYPKNPPIAYVTPTASMLVRPSKIVDVSGRLGGEYLSSWTRKSEGCNMVQFCELLQAVFSREPPLYAKPSSAMSPSKTAGSRPSSSGSLASPLGGHRPAPPPPLGAHIHSPISPHRPPLPDPYRSSAASPPPLRPPLPQEPVAGPSRQTPSQMNGVSGHHQSSAQPPSYAGYRPAPRPPLPSLPLQAPSPTGYATPRPLPPPQQQSTPTPGHYQHSGQYQAPNPQAAPPLPPPITTYPGQVAPSATGARPAATTARNLLDEPDDVTSPSRDGPEGIQMRAPARPVNPELLQRRAALQAKLDHALATVAAQHQSEADSLASLGTDLAKGGPAIADEMARLEAVRDVCINVRDRYAEVVSRAERNLGDMATKGEPEADDLVCSTTVVYNQLLDLVAEDHAIEDTCYQLYNALNADPPRIELDKFLKRTRALGREQFVKRALANKIILEMAIRPPRH